MEAFFAYSSTPTEIGAAIEAFVEGENRGRSDGRIHSWRANEIAGYCLVDPILDNIRSAEYIAADITVLNFNVVYEIGFAIGSNKRVILTCNSSIEGDDQLRTEVGIFDTLGYEPYENSEDLRKIFQKSISKKPLRIGTEMNSKAPVYIVLPREKTESELRITSRLKKIARLNYRSYDPTENPRMSVVSALTSISESHGVIIPLVPGSRKRSKVHNLRCAFIAGLAHALHKETLILQSGWTPVPLDYRDHVISYGAPSDIDSHIASFAPRISELLQQETQSEIEGTDNPLSKFFLGESAAENEFRDLGKYYVPVAQFSQVLNGEVQVVTGRKGSGKSALFFQLRDKIRKEKKNIVIDLNPEGYQLRKFKSLVIDRLEKGTMEHTVSAFWEYLLLLEICYKILEKDRGRSQYDHTIQDAYFELRKLYKDDDLIQEGDFAERLLLLTATIVERLEETVDGETGLLISRAGVTELLYSHDIKKLKVAVSEYLQIKGDLWILFDNLDKGWSADGVAEEDLLMLRCLLEALRKTQNQFRKKDIVARGVVFVRNDVYDQLVSTTSDRGKTSRVAMEWDDPDILRELIRKRLVSKSSNVETGFDDIWRKFVVSHLHDGVETSEFVISRSLYRPRCLLDLLTHAKSHALNLGHVKIEEVDLLWAEKQYSIDLIHNLELEIADILPDSEGCLYRFIEAPRFLEPGDLIRILEGVVRDEEMKSLTDLLIWHGFLGIYRNSGSETYIYDVNYDMRKIKALIEKRKSGELIFCINLAFGSGLDLSC